MGDSNTKPFAESAFMAKLQRVLIADSFGANPVSSTLDAPAKRDPDGNVSNLPRKWEIEYQLTGMSYGRLTFSKENTHFLR
jgi:hypothetical protein